jgi:hypothetical protein
VVDPRHLTPRPAPTLTREALTADDNGATVIVREGHQISVTLGGTAGVKWYRPGAGDGSLLRLVSAGGGYPSSTPMRATYLALAPGVSEITTTGDLPCHRPPTPCGAPNPMWRVEVIIQR